MPHRDFALMQILYAERITKRASQFFELQNFFRIGLFVHAMQRFDTAFSK